MNPPSDESCSPSSGVGWRLPLLGLLLAIVLLAWAARNVDPAALAAELRRVEPGWIAGAALAQVAALVCRGARWRSLLRPGGDVPWRAALAATFVGWVALVALPARLGELARPWLLARRHPFDRSFAFGAQQLERLLDLACLVVLLAAYLVGAPAGELTREGGRMLEALRRAGWLLALAVALVATFLVAGARLAPRFAARFEERGAPGERRARRVWLSSRARAFARGLTAIRSLPALAVAVLYSLALWLLLGAAHLCLFRAFDLALPATAVGPLLAFAVLGALVPTPAAIGSYHLAVQSALVALFGVTLERASGYALVAHATAYLPPLTIGVLVAFAEGVPIGALLRGGRGAGPAER